MLTDDFNLKVFFSDRVMPLIKKYGFSAVIVVFGLHLHAQAYRWEPFWDFEDGEPSMLYKRLSNSMAQTQAVTARWFILIGMLIGTGLYCGLLDRIRRINKGE